MFFFCSQGDGKQILCGLGDNSVSLYKSSLNGNPAVFTGKSREHSKLLLLKISLTSMSLSYLGCPLEGGRDKRVVKVALKQWVTGRLFPSHCLSLNSTIKVNVAFTLCVRFSFTSDLCVNTGHDRPVSSVSWSLNRQWWLSASEDHSLRIWTQGRSEPAIIMVNIVIHSNLLIF